MRYIERYENYKNAVTRLEEVIKAYKKTPNELLIDSMIHRFEFSVELAWKLLKKPIL